MAINTDCLILDGHTTAEMNSMTPPKGTMIYNSDTNTFWGYNGTEWKEIDFKI